MRNIWFERTKLPGNFALWGEREGDAKYPENFLLKCLELWHFVKYLIGNWLWTVVLEAKLNEATLVKSEKGSTFAWLNISLSFCVTGWDSARRNLYDLFVIWRPHVYQTLYVNSKKFCVNITFAGCCTQVLRFLTCWCLHRSCTMTRINAMNSLLDNIPIYLVVNALDYHGTSSDMLWKHGTW